MQMQMDDALFYRVPEAATEPHSVRDAVLRLASLDKGCGFQ